jgi:endonuclease III related protein
VRTAPVEEAADDTVALPNRTSNARSQKPIMHKQSPTTKKLLRIYEAQHAHFGHRNWWPGDTPFEVCVGAVLTQNTAWKNVAKAIANLKAAACLDLVTMFRLSHDELATLIRPAGYFNVKAVRLRNFLAHVVERHEADLEAFLSLPMETLREELLSVKGVGKETADSIILYAAGKPIFVVDAYTKRVLERHGLMEPRSSYDAVQDLFHGALPSDVDLYNDFHAQFVAVGHHFCKKNPRCEACPLGALLDRTVHIGPVEART